MPDFHVAEDPRKGLLTPPTGELRPDGVAGAGR
jgi:hypothetical protein